MVETVAPTPALRAEVCGSAQGVSQVRDDTLIARCAQALRRARRAAVAPVVVPNYDISAT